MAKLVEERWISNFGLVQPQNKKHQPLIIVVDKPEKTPPKPVVLFVTPEHKKPYNHIFVTPKLHKDPYELLLLKHMQILHVLHQIDKLAKYKNMIPHVKIGGEKYYVKTVLDPFSKDGHKKVVDINGKRHDVIEIKNPKDPKHNVNIVVIKGKVHIVRGNMDLLNLKIKDYVA